MRPATEHGLETALDWEPGSIRAILAGGDPTVLPAPTSAELEQDFEQTERLLEELEGRIGRGLPPNRDRELRAVMQILRSIAEESSTGPT